ncbi:MAG: hypothetical protein RL632_1731 [Bacteroidota bacterium]|jgi:hypothetical protein
MSEFKFNATETLENTVPLQHGFFLCVLHADKIPPHVGCLVDGQFFSLKVNGKDEQIPVNQLFKALSLKQVPTLFIRVDREIKLNWVKEVYANYTAIQVGQSTCLSPLVELFKCKESVRKLSGFLEYLDAQGLIDTVFKVHLTDEFTAISAYSLEEIEQHLVYLSDVKGR